MFLDYFLPRLSSDTVSFFLPLALRAARTLRPLAVDILSLNPCLCLRLVFEGWYVLFILLINYSFYSYHFFGLQKYTFFLFNNTLLKKYFQDLFDPVESRYSLLLLTCFTPLYNLKIVYIILMYYQQKLIFFHIKIYNFQCINDLWWYKNIKYQSIRYLYKNYTEKRPF